MCGIYCYLNCNESRGGDSYFSTIEDIKRCIKNRGPDGFSEYSTHFEPKWSLNFGCSVLWLQGLEPVLQPVVDKNSNVLLWNGDIFRGSLVSIL